jgi:hypothetical protein
MTLTAVMPIGLGRSFALCEKISSNGIDSNPRGRLFKYLAGSYLALFMAI